MLSRIWIFFISFVILLLFEFYFSLPFYYIWVWFSYLQNTFTLLSYYIPISPLVFYSYLSLPLLFLFKFAYKKLVTHDN